MQSKLSSELTYYLKEKAEKKVSIKDFLSFNGASLPENLECAKSRIVINYGNMFGNYLLIFGVVICLYLIMHPILIIPAVFSGAMLYMITKCEGEEVIIFGNNFKREHLYLAAVVVPVLFLILMPWTLVSLFFTLSIGLMLSVGHMLVFKPVVAAEDV
ncbi:PRA1 family protein 1 [Nematocida homosporus]|uniref:PRA1 family protein 1 n=1 Tax=Nematocida homosporus TaxID=1912981 RepID=UPI0022207734|nr:PRA1 family protein 1 [Nematocida homosporus]KAI5187579.1 PRA1 family protein 1 [Nematocida homosporus]